MYLEMSKSIHINMPGICIYMLVSTSIYQEQLRIKTGYPRFQPQGRHRFLIHQPHLPLPIPLPAGSLHPPDRLDQAALGYLQGDIIDLIRSLDLGYSNLRPGLPIFSPQVRAI